MGARKMTRRRPHAAPRRGARRWVRSVTTVSTDPPRGLFNGDARTIARSLASRRVSPKGPASGLRMLLFYLNRGGRGPSPTRRAELEKVKRLMQGMFGGREPRARRRAR
jgi:tRNA(adenine34) deaminase